MNYSQYLNGVFLCISKCFGLKLYCDLGLITILFIQRPFWVHVNSLWLTSDYMFSLFIFVIICSFLMHCLNDFFKESDGKFSLVYLSPEMLLDSEWNKTLLKSENISGTSVCDSNWWGSSTRHMVIKYVL